MEKSIKLILDNMAYDMSIDAYPTLNVPIITHSDGSFEAHEPTAAKWNPMKFCLEDEYSEYDKEEIVERIYKASEKSYHEKIFIIPVGHPYNAVWEVSNVFFYYNDVGEHMLSFSYCKALI